MLIPWKDSYHIDYGPIDNDHKALISMINAVIAELREADTLSLVADRLTHIGAFARAHFAREEMLQRISNFTGRGEHQAAHRALLDELDAFIRSLQFDEEGQDQQSEAFQSRKIRTFLYRWLLSHIIEEDTQMRPFVAAMSEAADNLVPLRAAS